MLRISLGPAGRRRLSGYAEELERFCREPFADQMPTVELRGRWRGRLIAAYEGAYARVAVMALAKEVATLQNEYRQSETLFSTYRERIGSLRALGPALLAFGFVAAWLMVYMVVWVIDPAAWSGVGQEQARFGDFVFLAVGNAFGGAGNSSIEAQAQGVRMLVLAEAITAATILALYVKLVWEDTDA